MIQKKKEMKAVWNYRIKAKCLKRKKVDNNDEFKPTDEKAVSEV